MSPSECNLPVLKEADFRAKEWAARTVRLSGAYGNTIVEKIATMTATEVAVVFLHADKKPRSSYYTAAEMDALCVAWTQYKADLAAAKDTELTRLQAVIKEADQLAASIPAIAIKAGSAWWNVTIPATEWGNPGYYVYHADAYLQRVKEARNALRTWILWWQEDSNQACIAATPERYAEQVALLAQYGYLANEDELVVESEDD